ncbi:MAG: hypothetical protein WAX89_02640, partial [Alphaproteobacteria bacterium]
ALVVEGRYFKTLTDPTYSRPQLQGGTYSLTSSESNASTALSHASQTGKLDWCDYGRPLTNTTSHYNATNNSYSHSYSYSSSQFTQSTQRYSAPHEDATLLVGLKYTFRTPQHKRFASLADIQPSAAPAPEQVLYYNRTSSYGHYPQPAAPVVSDREAERIYWQERNARYVPWHQPRPYSSPMANLPTRPNVYPERGTSFPRMVDNREEPDNLK